MAKILDSVPVYKKELFTFHRPTCMFTTEASTLGRKDWSKRLYDDACDEGFGILSPATGKVVYFSFTKLVRHPLEGNIEAWHFTAVVEPNSTLAGLKVVVFND